jgi:hypothetical protein
LEYNQWNDSLSGLEKKEKGKYWGLMASFEIECRSQNPSLTTEDVRKALYFSSGIFAPAREILLNDFDLTKCTPAMRMAIFTPSEDSLLQGGKYVQFKELATILDRLEFLGIEPQPTSELGQMISNQIYEN